MKSILVSLILVNIVWGQVVTISPIEIVMKTKDTYGNTINFSATSDTYRWNKQHYLTTQYQTVTMSISGDNLGCDHGFGFGNRLEEITLAHSIYTIRVTNSGKSAWFKIDAIGCTFNGDIYVTYDYLEDDFYIGGSCSAYGTEIISNQTITMYCNPICLQPTTPTNLQNNDLTEHPVLYWTASQPISEAHYEIWRKICGGFRYSEIIEDWTCIVSNLSDTNYLDREIYLSGSSYKAYYKIRAVSGDGCIYSPGWSNEISIIGNFLPLDRQPFQQKLSIDPTPRFNLFPNPFNSTIRINLCSPMKQITDIMIYDLQGRTVKEFRPAPGIYYFDTIWNGFDNQGQPIQSGIYFLIAHNGSKTLFNQKIIYLK